MSDGMSRRAFLGYTALAAGALATSHLNIASPTAWAAPATPPTRPYLSNVRIQATALEFITVQRKEGKTWSPAIAGKPFPLVTRTDLAKRHSLRPTHPLLAFAQLSDLHVTDAQSPSRMEFAHARVRSAYHPHEPLIPFGVNAAVKRINRYPYGPITGRHLDFVVMGGDATDNHEKVELDWVMRILNGGSFIANTGHPHKWEGVGATGDPYYWQPSSSAADVYKNRGFPTIRDFWHTLLRTPVQCPGLKVPWYAVQGNHDNCFIGAFPDSPIVNQFYVGAKKLMNLDLDDLLGNTYPELDKDTNPLADIITGKKEFLTTVTPDKRRAPFTVTEYVNEHFKPENLGPGPRGHGFTGTNTRPYYLFEMVPGVAGIVLDTNKPDGGPDGWLGGRQMAWLEQQLKRLNSRYFDTDGTLHRTGVKDKLVFLFTHHPSTNINSRGKATPRDGEDCPSSHSAAEIVTLLQRFPSVVAWVNGHTHGSCITPHKHSNPLRSFWEINTPSFVDWPHMGRMIELADNHDGTLSLFTTLFEPDIPHNPGAAANAQDRLASLYRELALNDFENDWKSLIGTVRDGNTELVLTNPLTNRLGH